MVYVALGYAGLSFGFFLPFGKTVGEKIRGGCRNGNGRRKMFFCREFAFVTGNRVGETALLPFLVGILGYQKVDQVGEYDGLIFLLTLFWLEASFLLWLSIFRAEKLNFNHYLVISAFTFDSIDESCFSGKSGKFISDIFSGRMCLCFFSQKNSNTPLYLRRRFNDFNIGRRNDLRHDFSQRQTERSACQF